MNHLPPLLALSLTCAAPLSAQDHVGGPPCIVELGQAAGERGGFVVEGGEDGLGGEMAGCTGIARFDPRPEIGPFVLGGIIARRLYPGVHGALAGGVNRR